MSSDFIDFLKKPATALSFLIIIFILVPIILTVLAHNYEKKIIIFFSIFFINLFICEIIFLFLYRLLNGVNYQFIKKINFEKLTHEPHPYLPFVYKKNFHGGRAEQTNYPLHPNLKSLSISTNNYRYYNGEKGHRKVVTPKPDNLIRINCIGGSTTGNYIHFENKVYSYPLELERILQKKTKKKLEVNNFGHGGYNTADSLVSFILKDIDTNPDYIIIYHAGNDIRSYLVPNFTSDYSHSRKNLGEVYWKFYIGSKIPNIPIKFINYLTNKFLFPTNEQYSLLEVVRKGQLNLNADYSEGLKTYERNLQHIIDISLRNDIKIILCTFCMYIYPRIKDHNLHKLYKKIVKKENEILKKLAAKNNLDLVDAASLIKNEDSNFVDSVHFTPKGMHLLAKCISEKINL